MNGVVTDLLALARALRAGQVTTTETADRLLILAHRVHVSVTQAECLPVRDEMSASSAPGDEGA